MLGRGYATGEEGHQVGDRVVHYREPSARGTIEEVAENKLSVMVRWDDIEGLDFQWANKVLKTPRT